MANVFALIKSKSEVEALAKQSVTGDFRVLEPTVEQLESLTYEQSVQQANDLYDFSYEDALNRVDPKHHGLFAHTVKETIRAARANKITQHQLKRNRFKALKASMTIEQATAKLKEIVESFHIRGARTGEYSGLSVEVKRGNCEATLYVRLDSNRDDAIENPDDPSERCYPYTVRTEVSWSSTTRDIPTAMVAVAIYQELIQVAAEVEATMRTERVVHVYGGKTEAVED